MITDRIKAIEQAIIKAKEYLESGEHADWKAFRPLFNRKFKDGKEVPPHKDWIKNVFIPRQEKALRLCEKALERVNKPKHQRRRNEYLCGGFNGLQHIVINYNEDGSVTRTINGVDEYYATEQEFKDTMERMYRNYLENL